MVFGEIAKKILLCLILTGMVNYTIVILFSLYYEYISSSQYRHGIEYGFIFYYLYFYYFFSLLLTIFIKRLNILILLLLHFYWIGITAFHNNPLKGLMIMTLIFTSHVFCVFLNGWTKAFKR